ncbi:Lipopolysaccharide heptosyltransferase I [Acidisarcina polymorpha]|uniref:Lipopolysaccharide heptosyltransferase I n=1 Tax=Acidisarcina polymorpha TaxID=2211140 RepID=A0A2Z5G9V2_9BACT|nr:glycosyltransferase family 9 protein [Acidisarcina polymorpha]AXC15345.1 Lipopolysaccharide heptosyltransferase I [Acidisarcina polymorpha]
MCAERKLRVLIVRLGAMGDILHALPAATALRQAHPEWYLGWAVEPRWQALFRADSGSSIRDGAMPLVDRLHLVDAKSWGRRPLSPSTLRDIRRVRMELRQANYDVCVDLQGAVRSAVIGRWAAANRMIGEDQPRERAARRFFRERVATTGRHVIEQATEVLEAIAGEKLSGVPPLLPQDTAAEDWVARLLARHVSSPFVIMNPGAGWGAKRWPAERYGSVAKQLARMGFGVVINAGPEEVELAAELAAASGGAAVPINPTMGELIELTRKASLTIAGDTGPLHLACALGKPVVGIFGPTDPARNGPFGCSFKVLRHPESKRDHSRRSEPESGLLTIMPDDVVAAAAELLKEQGAGRGR